MRVAKWDDPNSKYGGKKVTEARRRCGVGPDVWDYTILKRVTSKSQSNLKKRLKHWENHFIHKKDAVDNGYNSSYGDGWKDMKLSNEHKRKISENHRDYQTEAAKKKISEAQKGKKVSDATKGKISVGNKSKKRTTAQNAAQSARMKGNHPSAASAGLAAAIKANGNHGLNYGKKLSPEGVANIRKAHESQRKLATGIDPDGKKHHFESILEAAQKTGHGAGSVHHAMKTGGTTRKGWKFSG